MVCLCCNRAERRDLLGFFPHSSFLPQDKVSEFAAMTAAELLKETQRAAGDEKLTEWHETLIESGKTLRQVQEVGISTHFVTLRLGYDLCS